jgi:hypothetical protein
LTGCGTVGLIRRRRVAGAEVWVLRSVGSRTVFRVAIFCSLFGQSVFDPGNAFERS